MRINSRLKQALLAILFLAGVYGIMAIALKTVGLENAQEWIKQAGIWAPLLFVVLCVASLIIAPLSGSSLFIVGGAVFGKEPGFLLSFLASTIGCSVNFWISRLSGRKVAAHLIGKRNLDDLDRFAQRLNSRHSIVYMIVLMPLSQDIVSYAVGLTNVNYWHFLTALVISGAAIVAVYIYLGTGLLEALI